MSLFMAEVPPHASNYMVLRGRGEGGILRLIDEPWLIDRGTTSFVGRFVIEIGWIGKGFEEGRRDCWKSFLVIEQKICWIRCNPVDCGFAGVRYRDGFHLFLLVD